MSTYQANGPVRGRIQPWLIYAMMRFLAGPVGQIPRHATYRTTDFLADLLWRAYPCVRGGLLHNLSHAMQAPASDPAVAQAARRAYGHLWFNYLDLLRAPTLSPEALSQAVTIEGEAILQQTMASHGRVIIVTGHFAGGELALQAMAARGWAACVPAEHVRPEAFFRWLCDLRGRHGHSIIASDALLKPLVQVLRTRGSVMLTLDRDANQTGQPVRLCGAMARLPAGAAVLSQRYQVPMVPVHARRHSDGRVGLTVGEPLRNPGGRHNPGLEILADALERMIVDAPEQWVLTTPLWDGSIDA